MMPSRVAFERLGAMRARAQPVRLCPEPARRQATIAAEVARALDLGHATASCHLRHLPSSGLFTIAGTEKMRGGIATLYGYSPELEPRGAGGPTPQATLQVLADEIVRQGRHARLCRQVVTDADLWVSEEAWTATRTAVFETVDALHRAGPAESRGAMRASTTVAILLLDAS